MITQSGRYCHHSTETESNAAGLSCQQRVRVLNYTSTGLSPTTPMTVSGSVGGLVPGRHGFIVLVINCRFYSILFRRVYLRLSFQR